MKPIRYLDRTTQTEQEETIYGRTFVQLLYGPSFLSHLLATFISKLSFLSKLYGFFQKTSLSQRKIFPFIKKFHVDTSEFQDPVSSFKSFNDFFIRKLKPASRPIVQDPHTAILPADARYLVFPHIDSSHNFSIKNHSFSLSSLLQDSSLATQFTHGSMIIARLAPVDYHRFHFPCDGLAHTPKPIPGSLHSVNPYALKKHAEILSTNKRTLTLIDTPLFGPLLFIEVGAICVGTIHQTFSPNSFQTKGAEKGYFSFGGSCLILLFQPNTIQLDPDLLAASSRSLETLGKMGQSLGKAS